MIPVLVGQVLMLGATVALGIVLLPAVIGLRALHQAGRCGWLYFRIFAEVLGIPDARTATPPPAPPRHHPVDGREPAYRQYLFGPARGDLSLVLSRIRTELPDDFRASSAKIWSNWMAGPWRAETLGARLFGLMNLYGLVLGTLLGGILLAVVTAVQIMTAALLLGLALTVILGLRAVDLTLLWVRGIRITCPRCYRRIGYPAYRCPGCGALHRDIRPGPYGVLRRRCSCDGQWLPTLLLLGSHRLTAYCPHPGCEVQLADRSGTATELMLPIFGGSNAGKTRLMAVMVMTMINNAARDGTGVDFADEATNRRFHQLLPTITAGEATHRTVAELPRAYSVYLRSHRGTRRLVHLFDTAGERFYDSERLEELQYLRAAGTFLFVIDPLSIEQVWACLQPATQLELDPLRGRHSPTFVFQQVLHNVEAMGVDPGRARLAVAVSKADLLQHAGVPAAPPDSASIEHWLDEVGLDNLVRSIRHSFGDVCFFQTMAMPRGDGIATGVPELIEWMLAGSRLPIRANG
jgi:Double-GTPase 2